MWDDVGVLRTETGLQRGLAAVADVKSELMDLGVADDNLAFNLTWHDWINLQSLVEISEVITRSALERENSRGAHFREDFPESGDIEKSYFTVAQQKDDKLEVRREDVKFTIVKPGETILPDDAPETLLG